MGRKPNMYVDLSVILNQQTPVYPGTIRTNLFAKAGLSLNGDALTTEQALKAIEFVLSCDEKILIPEIGIKHI